MYLERSFAEYSRTADLTALFYNANKRKQDKPLTAADWNPWTTPDELRRRRRESGDLVTWSQMGELWKTQLGQVDQPST